MAGANAAVSSRVEREGRREASKKGRAKGGGGRGRTSFGLGVGDERAKARWGRGPVLCGEGQGGGELCAVCCCVSVCRYPYPSRLPVVSVTGRCAIASWEAGAQTGKDTAMGIGPRSASRTDRRRTGPGSERSSEPRIDSRRTKTDSWEIWMRETSTLDQLVGSDERVWPICKCGGRGRKGPIGSGLNVLRSRRSLDRSKPAFPEQPTHRPLLLSCPPTVHRDAPPPAPARPRRLHRRQRPRTQRQDRSPSTARPPTPPAPAPRTDHPARRSPASSPHRALPSPALRPLSPALVLLFLFVLGALRILLPLVRLGIDRGRGRGLLFLLLVLRSRSRPR